MDAISEDFVFFKYDTIKKRFYLQIVKIAYEYDERVVKRSVHYHLQDKYCSKFQRLKCKTRKTTTFID